jgi:hypothetical protein
MVFNATFNIISVISWQSVLLVEETGVSRENYPILSVFYRYQKRFKYHILAHICYFLYLFQNIFFEGRCGRDRMVVGFTST